MSTSIVSELQLLLSMYDSDQFRFDDPQVLELLQALESGSGIADVDESLNPLVASSSFSFTFKLNTNFFIDMRIPHGYPNTEKVSVNCHCRGESSGSSSSSQITALNQKVREFILSAESGPDILQTIQHCQELYSDLEASGMSFGDNVSLQPFPAKEDASRMPLCRIWIHSHHIYNKHKRRFLVDTASQLHLTGFSLPGKPGFVCVEGFENDCDEYWSQVRQLTWQKITLVHKNVPIDEHAFDSFQELAMDKSSFMQFLNERNLDHVIKEYLGF